MQELRRFAGTGTVVSCLCLPNTELLDLSTLSTQGDNLCLSGPKLVFTLRPATPKILHFLSDQITFLIDLLNAVLCGLYPWKQCDKGFLLIYLLVDCYQGHVAPVLHIPVTSWLHQPMQKRVRRRQNTFPKLEVILSISF